MPKSSLRISFDTINSEKASPEYSAISSVYVALSLSLLLSVIAFSAGCNAEEPLKEQVFDSKQIAPFVEPDFPFITTSVDARELGSGFPSDNVTTRCLALRLGNEAYACFDTDLLRWSVAWTGEFLPMVTMAQISYRDFHNKKNQFPVITGSPQIATGLYPGWSGAELQFTDPRPPSPHPEGPSWGPLPQELGRWNGVYLQGRDVVLSYRVKDTNIYEKPGSITTGPETAFTRTFTIDNPEEPLSLVVAERRDGVRSERSDTTAYIYHGSGEDSVTAIGLAEPAQGVELKITDNRYITVQLSPDSDQPRLKFTLLIWSGPSDQIEHFEQMLTQADTGMPEFHNGGAPYWTQTVHTQGKVSPDTAAYVTDRLTLPIPNPWKRNVRVVDVAFLKSGRAALVTYEGDIWIVNGIDRNLRNLKWRRYASGLYEPQSIEVVRDTIYIFGREGIVRFHDLNDDGVADYYENFSNRMAQSMETREWPGDMVSAPDGGFYVAKGGAGDAGPRFAPTIVTGFRYGSRHSGSILKVSPDGGSLRQVATGLRMPYLGIHPETGVLTASDQQGNFVPSSPIYLVDDGDYYGVPAAAHRDPVPPVTSPLLWFPHSVDPSGAGQVWITGNKMGGLNGELVHLSYGRPGLFKILFDSTDTAVQGAASVIPGTYPAPTMKGALNPGDGQLYVTGFSLWGSNTDEISAFIRIRHTGMSSLLPEQFKVRDGGVMIRFGTGLDRETATNPANYQVKRWNYLRSEKYGSGHYKLDGSPGEELLPVFSAHISKDGRAVFLVVPNIKEVMQMQVSYNLKTTEGAAKEDQLWFSVNDVEKPDLAADGFPNLDIDKLALEEAPSRGRTDQSDEEISPERGRALFRNTGCMGCHSIDGNNQGYYGPTMQGLFGSERHFEDSTSTVADEAYIKESILHPENKVVKEYGREMPSFMGILSDKEIESITLYIKSLSAQSSQ